MSRDIRSYFSFGTAKARPSRISDDESPKSKVNGKAEKAIKKKKAIVIDSDDEEDPLPPSPKRKKPTSSSGKKETAKTPEQHLKPVNIIDVFGKNPVQRNDTSLQKNKVSSSVAACSPKKEVSEGIHHPAKVVDVIFDSSSEDEFVKRSKRAHGNIKVKEEKTFKDVRKTKSEEEKRSPSPVAIKPEKEGTKRSQRPVQKVVCLSDSSSEDDASKSSGQTQKTLPNKEGDSWRKEVSLPVAKKRETKGARRTTQLADYLSESSSDDEVVKRPRSSAGHSSDKRSVVVEGGVGKTKGKGEKGKVIAGRSDGGDVHRSPGGQDKRLIQVECSARSPKALEKGNRPEPITIRSPTESSACVKLDYGKGMEKEVAVEQKTTPRQRRRSSGPDTPQKGPEEGDKHASKGDVLDDSLKKKQRAMQYQRYLHREGPRNPGSKEIPEVKPNCLAGLTFVITGVLESLDREEASTLVQQCGGKVTSNVSKNTSYIVLGEEPGPAKLDKARKFGTKELTEDGLLDLVRAKANEMEGTDSLASRSDNLGKRAIKEEKGEHGSLPSPAKKQKKDVEDSNGGNKHGLVRKLAYMSKNYGISGINVGKGVQAPAIKLEKSSPPSLSTEVDDSSASASSKTSQAKSDDKMWVDKYKPTSLKQVIGQQGEKSNVNKLLRWLSNWQRYHGVHGKRPPRPGPWEKNDDGGFYRAALLSGPPGIGKTTSALLICKELGMDAIELNASDTRSKKLLESEVAELISSNSLSGYLKGGKKKDEGKRKVLVMDEVDGMAGNEDRGGVAALIQLIKESRIPIICICNDRAHPKIRSLVNHCYDLRFQRPRMEQIRGAMMSICFKEGVKVNPDDLANLISSTNQDIRQVLHQLNMWSADKNITAKAESTHSHKRKECLKDVRLGPWDVLRKVFSPEERRNTTINQQSELFFYDYNLGPLFVFENYPKVSPRSARNLKERLSLLAQTTESLAMGDIIQKVIRRNNAWKLLPSQAIFSSVLPGALMEGHLTGQIDFPSFLGKTSTKGKMERLAQEISLHTRVATRATKESIKLDYLTYLRNAILSPLVEESQEQSRGESSGVHIKEALDVMQGYSLLREDLDSIMELTNFPGGPDPMAKVSSKVKAAFTRAYNKEGIMTPYAVTMNVKKKRGGGGSLDDFYGEEGEGEEEFEDVDEEERENIDTDAMIKIKKPSARGGPSGSRGDSGRGGDKDAAMDCGKGKGRGKGSGGGGRGGKKRS